MRSNSAHALSRASVVIAPSLLEITGDNEVSIVDPDARLMGNNRGGVEVSCNVQSAVDAKHCLAVEINVTNNPSDHGQLSLMSKRVKKRLKIKRSFTVLADKGYYNGEDLFRCKKNKIVTIVARQKAGREAPNKDYNADKFTYIEGKDCYICPLGQELKRTGTRASRVYQNKKACEKCAEKTKCTTGVAKRFSVSHYQNVFIETDKRLADNLELYRRRQMIVEHPLGTIKRSMNGYYFLLRTIKKVRGEVALLFFAYNLKRVQNILGQQELMKRLASLLLCLFSFRDKLAAKWLQISRNYFEGEANMQILTQSDVPIVRKFGRDFRFQGRNPHIPRQTLNYVNLLEECRQWKKPVLPLFWLAV